MLDKQQFVKIFSGLCDIYGKVPSEFMFDTYYHIFKDYTEQEFGQAITKCLKERVYNTIPKPAEILEFLTGSSDDKALKAWLEAKEGVKKAGYHNTVEFNDPIISHCINELGGWMDFCSAKIEDLPFIEKRFFELYRLFLKREIKNPVKLVGWHEVTNNNLGFEKDIPKPVRIGFEENIKLIK